jgi:hypothetical protein
MRRLVFLVEEYSMKVLLEGFLPRLIPGLAFVCVSHEGKQDLEKSIPRKLQAWREPGVSFVVVRDNDGGDCLSLKARLVQMCGDAGRPDTLVRVICQELEAWYLGDPAALAAVFEDPDIAGIASKARYRQPDEVTQPGKAIQQLIPSFQKVGGARAMALHLSTEANSSRSFHAFVRGVRRVWEEGLRADW